MDTLHKNPILESISSLCAARTPKVSPSKMCVDLGLSKSLITKLKADPERSLQTDTAQKIADYFEVSVDRVLGISEQKEKPTLETKSELNMDDVKLLLGKMSSADLVELMGDIAAKLKERGGE